MNGNSNHDNRQTVALPRATATRRWCEFAVLYIAVPLLMRFLVPTKFMLPTLWLATAITLFIIARSDLPDRLHVILGWDNLLPYFRRVLLRFALAVPLLTLLLLWREPAALLELPRHNTLLWGLIMAAYPMISVFPQGIIYRVFYESRYAPLFGGRRLLSLVAGAAVFSLAHLPFRNHWALGFTFVGGLMFLTTYRRTQRAVAANLEHAMYGDFIFTIGWGKYLYHGTRALLERSV